MGKIILNIASSLDGYVARENGAVDWLPEIEESGFAEFLKTVDTVIMGKTTYDQVLAFGEYPYKGMKSYVFTKSGAPNDENAEFVSDVDRLVKEDLSDSDRNVWLVGGAGIITSFLNKGYVDEIILSIIPVVLGKGIALFQDIEQETGLELIKTTDYHGLVELHYAVLKTDCSSSMVSSGLATLKKR